jgi:hypothetical protein
MSLGFVVIDGMQPGTAILVEADAKPDDDLVAPAPDAMVGWPSAETPGLEIDRHVLSDRWLAGMHRGT